MSATLGGDAAEADPASHIAHMTHPAHQPPLRIAVLGAGYIGSAVAAEAIRRGHAAWAVRRSSAAGLRDGVTWLQGTVGGQPIAGMPESLDAVVLTVAPSSGADGYDATYPPAATAALALARATNARALVYTSSTGVYGERDGAWVDEASPRAGAGDGNRALIAAEDILLAADWDAVTILRVAGIYGPGRDPRPRMRNASLLPRRGEYWTNLAHRDDIVAAVMHVVEAPAAARIFNVSDGTPTIAADVARWLAASAGDAPESLVFASAEQRSRNNQRVSNSALVASGWSPRYPSFRVGFTTGL